MLVDEVFRFPPVEYIKHLILNPRAYRQILAVTFTNKATAEMKERILQQLYGIWVNDPASDPYLNRIREDLQRKNLSDPDIRRAAVSKASQLTVVSSLSSFFICSL